MGEKEKMYSEFLDVSRQTGVPINKVLDVFWHLSRDEVIENDELLRRVGVSRNALNQVKKHLSSYLKPATKETALMPGVSEEIIELYKGDYIVEEELFAGVLRSAYRESVELLSGIKGRRPKPKREYDQFTATIETTAKRAALLNFFGDVRGKRILFLGDDDFTSVVTANLRTAQNITAIDIDDRILNNIDSISGENGFGIKTLKYDARKPLLRELRGQFDVIFTDPPYTTEGVRLFVSRAIEALDRGNQTARIYVCYGNSDRAKERFLPIQEVLTTSGLMVRWVFDKFNRYHGAESIGSSSSLFVTEITPRTKPLVVGNYDRPIYTNN